jgi:hypothetical protein
MQTITLLQYSSPLLAAWLQVSENHSATRTHTILVDIIIEKKTGLNTICVIPMCMYLVQPSLQ